MKQTLGERSHFIRIFVLLCIGGFVLILNAPRIAGTLRSNTAWINLNINTSNEIVSAVKQTQEPALFGQAIEVDARNQSAWFGLGMSYALQGEVDSAIEAWSISETAPITLIEYGMDARDKGNLDNALIFFRAADALDKTNVNEGHFLAGTICQRIFATQNFLSESNPQYCSNYLTKNGGDLIVNGDFSTRALYGWEGEHLFTGKNAARLQIEELDDSGDPVVSLVGLDGGNHFGLYQKVSFIPGATVRFRGRFRLSGEDNLMARLLYIGWQAEDGTPQGNQGEQRSQKMVWTEFERTFRVPENIKPTIKFYPVIFSGKGTIWFDDIQLEMISD